MVQSRYFFKKENGKIVGYFPKLSNGNYQITEVKNNRTLQQNRLYFGYFLKQIVLFHKELGEVKTIDLLHEDFKKLFLKLRIKSDFSKKYIWKIGSTAELDTKQFKEYMEKINNFYMENQGWGVDLSINETDLLYRESQIV